MYVSSQLSSKSAKIRKIKIVISVTRETEKKTIKKLRLQRSKLVNRITYQQEKKGLNKMGSYNQEK